MFAMVTQDENLYTQHVPVIALATDFGTQDAYVGVMKGVVLSICPTARLIDLTHHIRPQNVQQAAFVLLSAFEYMPTDTIYLVVVDPGVGSARRPIGVKTNRGTFIGPDNGIFTYVLDQLEVQQITTLQTYNLPAISSTFHGRDVFSPAAAQLASGVAFETLGQPLSKLEKLPSPRFEIHEELIHGEVLYIDHFGNVVTSIGRLAWDVDDLLQLTPVFQSEGDVEARTLHIRPETCTLVIGEHRISPIRLTYSGVESGKLLTLINSAGQLEIAVNQGHAAEMIGVQVGAPVTLHINDEG